MLWRLQREIGTTLEKREVAAQLLSKIEGKKDQRFFARWMLAGFLKMQGRSRQMRSSSDSGSSCKMCSQKRGEYWKRACMEEKRLSSTVIHDALSWARDRMIPTSWIHGWGLSPLPGAYAYERLERSFKGCTSGTCRHRDHDPGAYAYRLRAERGYFLELLHRQTANALQLFPREEHITYLDIYAHLIEEEPLAYLETRTRRGFHTSIRFLTEDEVVGAFLRQISGEESVLHEYSFLCPS